MGCGSSKNLAKSASIKLVQKPLQKRASGYEEILVSKNGVEKQFVTLLCPSNTVARKLTEKESLKQAAPACNEVTQRRSFNSVAPAVEEPKEPDKNIETINAWEMLAGLEDDDEVEGLCREGTSKSLNSIKQCSENSGIKAVKEGEEARQGGDGGKGLSRKEMANELAALKAPSVEFTRTGSLRDWLLQGGQVLSPGSKVTPKSGSFEPSAASGSGEDCEEDVFDPELVAQLEQVMEELTMEEEEILKQIVEKWESRYEEGLLRSRSERCMVRN